MLLRLFNNKEFKKEGKEVEEEVVIRQKTRNASGFRYVNFSNLVQVTIKKGILSEDTLDAGLSWFWKCSITEEQGQSFEGLSSQ